jgi:hypothetical protein
MTLLTSSKYDYTDFTDSIMFLNISKTSVTYHMSIQSDVSHQPKNLYPDLTPNNDTIYSKV